MDGDEDDKLMAAFRAYDFDNSDSLDMQASKKQLIICTYYDKLLSSQAEQVTPIVVVELKVYLISYGEGEYQTTVLSFSMFRELVKKKLLPLDPLWREPIILDGYGGYKQQQQQYHHEQNRGGRCRGGDDDGRQPGGGHGRDDGRGRGGRGNGHFGGSGGNNNAVNGGGGKQGRFDRHGADVIGWNNNNNNNFQGVAAPPPRQGRGDGGRGNDNRGRGRGRGSPYNKGR